MGQCLDWNILTMHGTPSIASSQYTLHLLEILVVWKCFVYEKGVYIKY